MTRYPLAKRLALLAGLSLFVAFWAALPTSQAQTVDPGFRDGELYVLLTPQAHSTMPSHWQVADGLADLPEAWHPLVATYGLLDYRPASRLPDGPLPRYRRLRFAEWEAADQLVAALNALPGVELAEKREIHRIYYIPNDFDNNDTYHLFRIEALKAFNYGRGSKDVKIAVVDDAVRTTHEDLRDALWTNPGEIPNDSIDNDNNGYVDDVNGWDAAGASQATTVPDNDANPPANRVSNTRFSHGTHCAGIAAATSDNGKGVASAAFNVSLIPIKATPDDANNTLSIYEGYDGIEYAIAAGADVVSLSWGGNNSSSFAQNVVRAAHNRGIVLVAAAGNDGHAIPQFPAAFPEVISVGMTDPNDRVHRNSNYGNWVNIMAPGGIYSSVAGSDNSYRYNLGTSMATPLVASCLGFMKAYKPATSVEQLTQALYAGATNIDNINPSFVDQMGAGRVNLFGAVQALRQPTCDTVLREDFIDTTQAGPVTDSLGVVPNSNHGANLAVAMRHPDGGGYNLVAGVRFWLAQRVVANPTDSLTVAVYSNGNQDEPQYELRSAKVALGDLLLGQANEVRFDTAAQPFGRYHLVIQWPQTGNTGDTLVLAATLRDSQDAVLAAYSRLNTGLWFAQTTLHRTDSGEALDPIVAIAPIQTATEAGLDARIELPDTIIAGVDAALTGRSNMGTRFVWQIGNTSITGDSIAHRFPETGQFTIRFISFLGTCSATDSATVQVLAPNSREEATLRQPYAYPVPSTSTNLRLAHWGAAEPVQAPVLGLNGQLCGHAQVQPGGAVALPHGMAAGTYHLMLPGVAQPVRFWLR